ncbi:LysR family transcriptional regulator, partial [Bacillus subtilis]
YMVKEHVKNGLLIPKQIQNPRQDSHMLLATQHSATGLVTQWIRKEFTNNGILANLYNDMLKPISPQ